MELSVVIVNYNVKYFLEHCLHSVYKSLKNIEAEVFVVDNNSVDGSIGMIREKFPKVELILNKKNVGFARANNQAIKKAVGKYILILNPDTVIEENTLEKCIRFMEDHDDAGSLGVRMIDGKGKFLPESKRSLPTPSVAFYKIFGLAALFPRSRIFGRYHLGYLDKDKTNSVEVLPGAFMMIRKTVLKKTGLLDEDYFMYGEDIDLSYRITMAGYKNYYYPGTTIIHYKGESTKKGSINYVMVFYRAMIIFARKHFTRNNAKFFSLLINTAIYLRAAASIIRRFITGTVNPLLNIIAIYAGYYFVLPYWEKFVFKHSGSYPKEYLMIVVPSYILVWIISIYLSGGYEKHIKTGNLLRGVLFGTLTILVIYALLPESFRFSRALIIFGTLWAFISTFIIRLLLNSLNRENFRFEIIREKKRILIVGDGDESKRVFSILRQSNIKPELVGKVYPDVKAPDGGFIGNITQIEEIVAINKVDEIIFCSKNISSQEIIKAMLHFTHTDVDFKIAPPESFSIIGSNSINTAGELYILNLNTISRNINQRRKRFLDMVISLILILLSPILVLFIKHPGIMLRNLILTFTGRFTIVGYHGKIKEEKDKLPVLKKGILSPVDALENKAIDSDIAEKVNILYAKDYRILNDLNILFKGYKNLGRKVK